MKGKYKTIIDICRTIMIITQNRPANNIAQKMKFSIKYFFNKCDQIRSGHIY